jgi:hypothetical protein
MPNVPIGTYSNGSFQRTMSPTWDLNTGNVAGGIKTVVFCPHQSYSFMTYQIEFTPKVPKDATKRLRLDIRYSLTRRP